ncbi:MAG: hypothetical protein CMH54_10665 [Myxococcales bacterium]|nr:hypothetical protein [Myxococcales bacterium]
MATKVLLTGGTGFLGRALEKQLRVGGYDVVALGSSDCDLIDFEATLTTFGAIQPDVVLHAAAVTGGIGICSEKPATLFHQNTSMLLHVLEAARIAKATHFVGIGSSCAYPGDRWGDLSEEELWNGGLHPSVEGFGVTKRITEAGLRAYQKEFGLRTQFPILANLYGEHDNFDLDSSHVLAALVRRFVEAAEEGAAAVTCWGSGSPIREFLYVDDAAEGVVKLMETPVSQPINIGSGAGITIRDLVGEIVRLTGFKGEIHWDTDRPDGSPRKVLDVRHMKNLMDWRPQTALSEGLERTIAWYRQSRASG